MLLLSSGRVVDILTTRAKFHALKIHGPAADADHRALYGLVDVVIRLVDTEGQPRRGWTEFDYNFSGYTLATIHQAKDWSDAEKSELSHWASQHTQKTLIETARRRLIKHQLQLSVKINSSPQFLFSLLQHRINRLSLNRASVHQWRATIHNMQHTGIRQEEVNWSGLQYFLNNKAGSEILTKKQILDAINFKNIRLELSTEQIWGTDGGLSFKEVAQRMPHQAVYRAALKLDNDCLCILRYIDHTYNYRVGVIKTRSSNHHLALNKFWFSLDPYGRAIINKKTNERYFNTSESAMSAANYNARKNMGLRCGAKFNAQYDHLTLFGGHDYREWKISLPDYQRTFFGAHFFDHNVLAHIRTTIRQDNQGRKLLFIEEIQSDWHQNGQVKGYDTSYWGKVANAPFKKEWASLAIKLMLIRASQNGFDGIAWAGGKIQESRYTKNLPAIKRHYDMELPKTLNKLGKVFKCSVESTLIDTRDPWLNIIKSHNKWRVADGNGKFKTRNKYNSREEAMTVIHRHCKNIQLSVYMFLLNDNLRWQISEYGLPMFGETMKDTTTTAFLKKCSNLEPW